jgi:hypothetical protein
MLRSNIPGRGLRGVSIYLQDWRGFEGIRNGRVPESFSFLLVPSPL